MALVRFGGVASTTPEMHALFAALHGPAFLDEPVLLCGEVASGPRRSHARCTS